MLLSLAGGVIGILAGIGGFAVFSSLGDMRTVIAPASILLAFSSAAGVGIFFGFYPANQSRPIRPYRSLEARVIRTRQNYQENTMKKTILITTLFILAAALTACNGAASANVSTDTVDGQLSTDYENALSIPMQLAVGTFRLDGTDDQVDVDTASALLPLWKALRSLSSSDSAAAEEIQAVYNQIQETMTPEQIQAISEMQLTFGDMGEVAQKLDLNFGVGGRFGDFTPEQQETAQAARESGQYT